MKILNITALLLLYTIIMGCSSSPAEENDAIDKVVVEDLSNNSSILGEWVGSHWEVNGFGEMNSEENLMMFEFNMEAQNLDENHYTITFNKDQTITTSGNKFTVKMTSKIDGMEFSQEIETDISLDSAQWELNGDILHIVLPDEPGITYSYKVKKLTNKELKLELDRLPEGISEAIGNEGHFEGTVKLEMVR